MKLVLLFDRRANTYTILGHNYEDEEADRIVREHRKKGGVAHHMSQSGTHEGPHASCRTCKRAVERMARRR